MNLKQNGLLVTMQHVGDTKSDVCNDLIFKKNGTSGTDYLIYLTGETANYNSQASVSAEAYFMYAKFNIATGITSLAEFSTFPVTTAPYSSYRNRNGIEIKNAGNYKKLAILTTGVYRPTNTTSGTYSNVLIRDFGDSSGNCIKQQQPPLKKFSIDFKQSSVALDTPAIKVYSEKWIRLNRLTVKELCQAIKIDPLRALNLKQDNSNSPLSMQALRINPNPANSVINVSIADGSLLTGKSKNAVLRIYNSAMQLENVVSVNAGQGNILKLPVAQLKPGIYMIQLVRGDEVLGSTFIKQ